VQTQTFSQRKKGHLKSNGVMHMPVVRSTVGRWGLRASGACALTCWHTWALKYERRWVYKRV
jgi:hypothetical protein